MQNTSLVACVDGAASVLPAPACPLPSNVLTRLPQSITPGAIIQCPAVQLASFVRQTAGLSPGLANVITTPYPQPSTPGAVLSDPTFVNAAGCACGAGQGGTPTLTLNATGQLQCVEQGGGGGGGGDTGSLTKNQWIILVVVLTIVPHIIVAAALFLFSKCASACCALACWPA